MSHVLAYLARVVTSNIILSYDNPYRGPLGVCGLYLGLLHYLVHCARGSEA